ncbi:unnamed protein product [Absidia cylindrospora]
MLLQVESVTNAKDFWSGAMVGIAERDLEQYRQVQAFLTYERAQEELALLKAMISLGDGLDDDIFTTLLF